MCETPQTPLKTESHVVVRGNAVLVPVLHKGEAEHPSAHLLGRLGSAQFSPQTSLLAVARVARQQLGRGR